MLVTDCDSCELCFFEEAVRAQYYAWTMTSYSEFRPPLSWRYLPEGKGKVNFGTAICSLQQARTRCCVIYNGPEVGIMLSAECHM